MDIPSQDEWNAFLNALQLCIASPIDGSSSAGTTSPLIKILAVVDGDVGLKKFEKLVPGHWERGGYCVEDISKMDISLLTSFLMLTRLQDTQIMSLAEQDGRYRQYANALKLTSHGGKTGITTISDARDAIFKAIDQKKISLKKISELTGLTSVSLSNFKAGGDIRLSNLLKIAKALGVKLVLN